MSCIPRFCLTILALSWAAMETASAAIPLVSVADAGNPADASGHGGVGYRYRLGAFEITRGQYAEFLNAVAGADGTDLYDPDMGIVRSGQAGSYTYAAGEPNKPVAHVTWFSALRFANWLHHGKPNGPPGPSTTEDGAYTFTGPDAVGSRNPGALYFLPTEDEWFKAAFYQGGSNGAYTLYPTRTDTLPRAEPPPGSGNSANYGNAANGPTDVGAYAASSGFYGTFDQAGNLWEWVETPDADGLPGIRGGSYQDYDTLLQSWYRDSEHPLAAAAIIGFRIAAAAEDPGSNRAPVATLDRYAVGMNGLLTISAPGVLANDADPDGDPLSATLASGPAHGVLTLSPNGAFVYRPASNYFGPDSFAYRADDGFSNGAQASVELTVTPPAFKINSAVWFQAERYLRVKGTGTPGASVTVKAAGVVIGKPTINAYGRWTLRVNGVRTAPVSVKAISGGTVLQLAVQVQP